MLEIVIIICLAVVLFLILHNFPKTTEGGMESNIMLQEKKSSGFFRNLLKKKPKDTSDAIKQAIINGQEKIIAPSETEMVQEKYRESNPEIAQLLHDADIALEKSDLREAEDAAINALSKDKKCAQAYDIIGRVAMLRGAFDEAKEAYKTALKCDHELGSAYFGLGQICLRDENYTDAIENMQRSVVLDRSHADWYAELGKAYMEVRQFAKAAKALKRATSLDIDNKSYKELAAEAEEKQRAHASAYRMR
ncbi:MAG: tetratricopeptide repeat protein [Patescibacteria group bacterium]|nr:tetratricopeptide repeat protein [Patescibacteria group bacterium]